MRVAALFAGIGGFELGFRRAGHDPILLCEIDPAASAVLRDRFSDVMLHGDIATLKDVGDVDIITAGFPCQDLSQAGRTLGMKGNQSNIVSHVFRLLAKRRVPWVVLENVPFMLQLGRGHALNYIVDELERLGYMWAYRVIDARCFGVPQRRERVFLVGSQKVDPRRVLFFGDEEPTEERSPEKHVAFGFYWTEGTRGLGWAENAVPTLKGGSTIGIPSPPAIWLPTGDFVQPEIRDAERLQGFPADWTLPAEKIAKRGARWKLVGNAVNVNVASWLGERLALLDGDTSLSGESLPKNKAWPDCAWNDGSGRRTGLLSTWPVRCKSQALAAFLTFPTKPLSERATAGFLSRFRVSSLKKPDGFLEALENHLRRVTVIERGRESNPQVRASRAKA